jgi:hypothetical protein
MKTITLAAILLQVTLVTTVGAAVPMQQRAADGPDAVTIPRLLSYQGKLTDTLGIPVADTVYAVRFRLYAQPTGGTQFWEEIQQVRTDAGLFAVMLGSVTPIGSMPDAGTAYLGMAVAGGAELTPRLRIASAAYAYLAERAANSDLLQGRDTTTFSRSTHNHDATYVNEGQASSVTGVMLVDGTVQTADVADTAVTMVKLARAGAATGQVVKWTGMAWAPGPDNTGGGTGVTNVYQDTGITCVPNPITTSGNVKLNLTYADGRYINEGQAASGDLIGTYPSPTITANAVGSAEVTDGSLRGADIAKPCTLSATVSPGAVLVLNNTGGGDALQAQGVIRVTGQIISTVAEDADNDAAGGNPAATGGQDAAPIVVTSTTTCTNLSADLLDGYNAAATGANVIPYTDGTGKLNVAVIPGMSYADSARVAANSHKLQGKDTTGFVRTGQANSVTSAMITDATVAAADLNQMGATTNQVLKWTGSAWQPRSDSLGAGDNAWVRGGDSVLYTIRMLGLARGGAGNALYGTSAFSHVNLGASCTTGTSGMPYAACIVLGGQNNAATSSAATVAGGSANKARGASSFVGGGGGNRAEGWLATVSGGNTNVAYGALSGIGSGWFNTAGTQYSDTGATVAGGKSNRATGMFSFVGGGQDNTADGSCVTVAGGEDNFTLLANHAVIGGGYQNHVEAGASTIAGGYSNSIGSSFASIGGGLRNGVGGTSGTIAGGDGSCVVGDRGAIGGGCADTVQAFCGTVGGGYGNLAGEATADTAAVIAGGWNNAATAKYSFVGGGRDNNATGRSSVVAGGDSSNTTGGDWGSVGGGCGNEVEDVYGTVAGGYHNRAGVAYGAIAGGSGNYTSGTYAAIGGGLNNTAGGVSSVTAGGQYNAAQGTSSTVAGGQWNSTAATCASVGGGYGNVVMGYASAVAGGETDSVIADWGAALSGHLNQAGDAVDDTATVVAGGWNNNATGKFNFVGGGYLNNASNNYAVIGGGRQNTVNGPQAVIAGGWGNLASGWHSTVAGGLNNSTLASASAVAGGERSSVSATGEWSTVAGGRYDTIAGSYSLAAGYNVRVRDAADYSLAFGENCSTSTPRAVVFYHSSAATKLGVGVQNPGYSIDVQGGAYCSGTNWVNGSSRKLKTDISALTPEQMRAVLEDLERIEVVNYRYKSEASGERHIGLIAEDAPELLATPARDGINTADAIGFLLAVAKAQQAEIEALKAELKAR